MTRFSLDTVPATPWKNGGGTTREIASWPPGAGLDDFQWRISVATIGASGPFSRFAGIDRTIMLIDGDGVHLRAPDGSIDHRLDVPLAPFAFSGDTPLDCTLLGGTSQDINVMTRHGALQAQVHVMRRPHTLDRCAHGLLLALRGSWVVRLRPGDDDAVRLEAHQGLWWAEQPCTAHIEPASDDAVLVAVSIETGATVS
ncbi:HutD family protein [Reyranella sp. CPCC 100927]|uniref:HutD/Ves family protein n=1 Tax=Reyranella sp. CPCC 100927 TaxID=2599616 RepID=UPI0011B5319B|nr:HutD family protein [Reyranella sp. CPCC 100927]TWS96157.1 HutD family protein [Reyranella sp. CPCC 100927]